MCGIVGITDFSNQSIEPALLLAMNGAIGHRGPDDEGYVLIDERRSQHRSFCGPDSPSDIKAKMPLLLAGDTSCCGNIGLGHRRFSIIDLSAAGHQPLFDRDRTCCVVFNGEIYNYVEIRDELVSRGVGFCSQSDTEVLLEAYKYWGTDCFARLNGFWTLAIYDFKKRTLLLSRDRIGKKPLYWTRHGTRVYFASEIKALFQIPEVYRQRQPNEASILQWLVYGRRDLGCDTCFKNIHSLPSGCWTILDHSFPNHVNVFWSLPKRRMSERDISIDEASGTIRSILLDSVKIRLRADVPFAIELSGGMDSSSLVAAAAQIHSGKITTYTVRFPEKEWNEEPYARSVAQHYNVDYRVLDSPSEDFWNQILAFTYQEEEPYHSPNLQTNQVIWSLMRSSGVKVSLNGAGGDEVFAGYGRYYDMAQIENLRHLRIGKYIKNTLQYSESNKKLKVLLRSLIKLMRDGVNFVLHSWPRNRQFSSNFSSGPLSEFRYFPLLSKALYRDMTNVLMPYWLRSGDKSHMGIPMEVRIPLLDYRLLDFVFSLPVTYLIRNGWHKWIFRKAVEDLLPENVVWRPQKMGYPFPYQQFYSKHADLIQVLLGEAQNPFLNFSEQNNFRQNWRVLSFILWYELFLNENVALFDGLERMARQVGTMADHGYEPRFMKTCRMAPALSKKRHASLMMASPEIARR